MTVIDCVSSIGARVCMCRYSVHVLGLVFDGRTRTCYLCDPNGVLLPGGNMEFVCVPFTARDGAPSTAVSAYDLAQQRKPKKRGKLRQGAS